MYFFLLWLPHTLGLVNFILKFFQIVFVLCNHFVILKVHSNFHNLFLDYYFEFGIYPIFFGLRLCQLNSVFQSFLDENFVIDSYYQNITVTTMTILQ